MPKPSKSRQTIIRRAPVLEFCVRGPSVSAQAKGSRGRQLLAAWRLRVLQGAEARWGVRVPLEDVLEVHVSEFSTMPLKDRDNMAKPILDALQGVVYNNDRQVRSLHVEWCDIDGHYRVRHMSMMLAEALSEGHEFIWIRVFMFEPRVSLQI